jgi:hypothetical protein
MEIDIQSQEAFPSNCGRLLSLTGGENMINLSEYNQRLSRLEAIREAAHVVGYCALRKECGLKLSAGMFERWPREYPREHGNRRTVRRRLKANLVHAIVFFAMPVAEAKYSRRRLFAAKNRKSDLHQACAHGFFSGCDSTIFIDASVDAARKLLYQERIWEAVNALADAFQADKWLKQTEGIEIIDPIISRGEALPVLGEALRATISSSHYLVSR